MATNYFEKNQPNIMRDIEKKCEICQKQFTVFKREHQCKRCMRAVCSDCGQEKVMVFKLGFTKRPHRGCKYCSEEIKKIKEYIASNQLQFAKMSGIGTKWIKKIQRRPFTNSIDNRKYKKFTKEVFSRMWDSYNFSMRQFIGLLTFDLNQDDVYQVMYDVYMTVISAVPEEDMESIAYLIIFLLCFCSPDKVPIICLYLIELKSSVADWQGLIQAYLKVLGVNEQINSKIKQYVRIRSKAFINSFSINYANTTLSILILDKVITRKKIDEIYMYFCLSIELIKDYLVKYRENVQLCDILILRNCTIETTSAKYKQANMVKSVNYLHEKQTSQNDDQNNSVNSFQQNTKERQKSNLMTASFSEGIRQQNKQPMLFNPMRYQEKETENREVLIRPFKRKGEDQFTEDSFSMISMIEQIQQAPKRQFNSSENDGQQLLNLLDQADRKSPNASIQIKTAISGSEEINSPIGRLYNSAESNRPKNQPCEACSISDKTIQQLNRQIVELRQQKSNFENIKKQNLQLKERFVKSSNSKIVQTFSLEKLEYQSQIRKLKQKVQQYQQRDKEQAVLTTKIEDYKRLTKKQELEIRTYQQQIQESNITLKMLKNKVESQSMSSTPQKQTDTSQSGKMIEILKLNIREKNQQIEQLSKKNKLLLYQIEQLLKEKTQDKQKAALQTRLTKSERQKDEILVKMKQLSNLLMQQEQQKLSLSEENFELQGLLKQHGIKIR